MSVTENMHLALTEEYRIDTRSYEFTHGKKPGGTGSWAFHLGQLSAPPVFVPGQMKYSDAVAWIKAHAKQIGTPDYTTIYAAT